jgi:hypothetical protein
MTRTLGRLQDGCLRLLAASQIPANSAEVGLDVDDRQIADRGLPDRGHLAGDAVARARALVLLELPVASDQ